MTKTINQFGAIGGIADTDELLIWDVSTSLTRKITLSNFSSGLANMPSIGGPWIAPTFNTGWGNYGSYQQVGYKKIGDLVLLRGMAGRTSGSNTTIFTLPAGFRPLAEEFFISISNNNTMARLRAYAHGPIVMEAGDYGWVTLSNIAFSTI